VIGRRLLLAGGAARVAAPARIAQERPARIMMMLFRGWEEACQGFSDYFKGRGIAVDLIIRDAKQQVAAVPDMVREAYDLKPDLVYIWGTGTATTALGPWDAIDPKRHLSGIPAVFNIVTDPVGNRIVPSLEHPGREVTGTIYIAPVRVQLATVTAYRPFQTIATTYNPLESNSLAVVSEMRRELAAGGQHLIDVPVSLGANGPDPGSIPGLVRGFRRAGAEWLYIPPDTFLNDYRADLTDTAVAVGLPTFAATERFVTFADGLAGLVCRYYNIGAFTGFKAEQILFGGLKASEIPIETLSRFSLLIRTETARRLGFFPPLTLLRYAEPV